MTYPFCAQTKIKALETRVALLEHSLALVMASQAPVKKPDPAGGAPMSVNSYWDAETRRMMATPSYTHPTTAQGPHGYVNTSVCLPNSGAIAAAAFHGRNPTPSEYLGSLSGGLSKLGHDLSKALHNSQAVHAATEALTWGQRYEAYKSSVRHQQVMGNCGPTVQGAHGYH